MISMLNIPNVSTLKCTPLQDPAWLRFGMFVAIVWVANAAVSYRRRMNAACIQATPLLGADRSEVSASDVLQALYTHSSRYP